VGDGDLSFSLALAMHVPGLRLTATTHLTRPDLDEAYGPARVAATVAALRAAPQSRVRVLHGVDATALHTNVAVLEGGGYDRVVWNFPCIAGMASRDADAQIAEIGANQRLLEAFFASCVAPPCPLSSSSSSSAALSGVLRPGPSEVHVAHKAKPPFGHWDIERCGERLESPAGQARSRQGCDG